MEVGMADNAFSALPIPSLTNTAPDVGEPDWWVSTLVRQLMYRQPILEKRQRYVEGKHDKPRGDPSYTTVFKKFQKLASSNYVGLITSAPVERMTVRGFRFGDAGTADEDAQAIWQANDMDMQSVTLHQHGSTFGLAYAVVTPPDHDSKVKTPTGLEIPIITAEDPRTAIVYRDPNRPTKTLAGLRMWADEIMGRIVAILYLPEGAYGFVGPETNTLENMTMEQTTNHLLGVGLAGGGFTQSGFVANPDGFTDIPLQEYVWRPNTGDVPWGEADPSIITVQDRLNQNIFDRIVISYFAAYPQRWAAGVETKFKPNSKNQPENPFEPGVNKMWGVDTPTAKFGQFDAADINQILASCQADISDMAALSKTPPHYFMGKMSNISGETLTQAESGLVSKTQLRMNTMGWSHIRLMKLCFAFLDDDRKDDPEAATLWSDPQKQLTADMALAGQQWSAIGIPLALIMERQGFTPDEIAFAVAEQEKQQQLEAQQAMQQQQMAQDHDLALAKATASPGTPANPGQPQPAAQPGVNKKATAAKNPTAKKPAAKPAAPKAA
jgi:hypothetical protein